MKRKAALTLIAKVYCAWLRSRMAPGGKSQVPLLEARLIMLIDMLPTLTPQEKSGPWDIGEAGSITEDNVKNALEWLFTAVTEAYSPNEWAMIWAQHARIDAQVHVQEIYQRILRPNNALDSSEHTAL